MVSGSPDVSNSFVSPYCNLFVSQSGWWFQALRLFPIHLSPHIPIHLSPSLAGGVRLFGCLQFSFVFPYNDSFVSQSGWWCPALRMSPIHLSSLIAIHFSQSGWWCPALRMFPIHLSPLITIHFSQSGWWCPALRMSPIHSSPLIAIHLFPKQFTVGVLNSLLNRCPALSKWWCPALRMSPIHLSPLIAIHLSPSLAGGVRLSGCFQFICLPL